MTPYIQSERQQNAPRVIVVEDERIVALDLQLTLSSMGYDVIGCAASEAEAVALTKSYRPDLVLMDINLESGGDGIVAADEITRDAEIPVVFLTAYADSDILRRAEKIAPYGYLVKPVEPLELGATLQMALARARATHERLRIERRLRLAVDAAQLCVMTLPDGDEWLELDGHFPLISRASLQRFRMPLEEFLGRMPLEGQDRVRSFLVNQGQLHLITPWRDLASAQGPGAFVELHARYVEGEKSIIGICRDVSRQVDQQNELRQAAVVFEATADAVLILDSDGRIAAANPAFVNLTGWTSAEVQGVRPEEFLKDRRTPDTVQTHGAGEGGAKHAEMVCVRKDGTTFPVWEHRAPVMDESGTVRQQVLTFSDISVLRIAEGRVRHLAYHDLLTGLGNRNRMREVLGELPNRRDGVGSSVALLFIDLDGFKVINDSMGHDVGDRLLVLVAERISRAVRAGDETIRLGGDEFVVLLKVQEEDEAAALADRLLDAIRQPIELTERAWVTVSASIGMARYPEDGLTADALLRAADVAMYSAKADGRNRWVRYQHQMTIAANERLAIEQGLIRAIDLGELSLHWQPQVSIDGSTLLGAEALLRWRSASLGEVSPARFIPIAEETGCIHDIGRWVLRQAVQSWADWRQQGLPVGRLAVNVSALQLIDDKFADDVSEVLRAGGVPATEIEIEVTETALQRVPFVEQRLQRLADLGLRIALDDFGTGHSSLSMLKILPIHRLKVDRAFIKDVITSSSDQAIVRAIVAVALALNFDLLAEGVETQAQGLCLQHLGVREAQGWLFAKAMPADRFIDWVKARPS